MSSTILADFHITPTLITNENESYDLVTTDLSHYQLPSIVPHTIAKYNTLRTYSFVQHNRAIDRNEDSTIDNKPLYETTGRSDRKKRIRSIPFNSIDIPQLNHDLVSTNSIVVGVDDTLKQSFIQLFNTTRGIYMRNKLYDIFNEYYSGDTYRCITHYTYSFTSGPFRLSCVRLGYDPRQYTLHQTIHSDGSVIYSSSEVMKWQVIDFRISPEYWKLICQYRKTLDTINDGGHADSSSSADDVDNGEYGVTELSDTSDIDDADDIQSQPSDSDEYGDNDNATDQPVTNDITLSSAATSSNTAVNIHFTDIPHTQISHYQLCEIHDDEIHRIINTAQCQATCHITTGFYDESTYNKIRSRMKQLLYEYMMTAGIDVQSIELSKSNMNTIAQSIRTARKQHKQQLKQQRQLQLTITNKHRRTVGINKREVERAAKRRLAAERNEQRKLLLLDELAADELNVMEMLPHNELNDSELIQVNAAVHAVMNNHNDNINNNYSNM